MIRPRVNGSTVDTPHAIGTSAHVAGYARLPDGRYLLEVEGSRRFRILNMESNGSYPSADVEWLAEEIGNFATAREAGDEVESMVFLYRALDGDGDLPVRLSIDPVVRSYQVAALLRMQFPRLTITARVSSSPLVSRYTGSGTIFSCTINERRNTPFSAR